MKDDDITCCDDCPDLKKRSKKPWCEALQAEARFVFLSTTANSVAIGCPRTKYGRKLCPKPTK